MKKKNCMLIYGLYICNIQTDIIKNFKTKQNQPKWFYYWCVYTPMGPNIELQCVTQWSYRRSIHASNWNFGVYIFFPLFFRFSLIWCASFEWQVIDKWKNIICKFRWPKFKSLEIVRCSAATGCLVIQPTVRTLNHWFLGTFRVGHLSWTDASPIRSNRKVPKFPFDQSNRK